MAAILAAPVAVEYQSRRWPAAPPRHGQRVLDQARLHVRLQAPTHHLTVEQVDDCCQVQPALVGLDVGDVATPELVGPLGVEAPLHQVGRHRLDDDESLGIGIVVRDRPGAGVVKEISEKEEA